MSCSGIPVIEPIAIEDTFISGISQIETVGSCVRFTFYAMHTSRDGHEVERVIVDKLIIALDDLPKAVGKALRYLAARGIQSAPRDLMRMLS